MNKIEKLMLLLIFVLIGMFTASVFWPQIINDTTDLLFTGLFGSVIFMAVWIVQDRIDQIPKNY